MPIPDGIYFGLPNEVYHADPALGSSDLKDILANAVQWWAKKRNAAWQELIRSHMTDKELKKADTESLAKMFGTALHAMVLEPETFDARYFVRPPRPEWPETIGEIEGALKHAGHDVPRSSSRRADFVAAARIAGIKTTDDWEDELALMGAGRIPITLRWDALLRMLHTVLERHEEAPKWLRNGRAEVSVFWTDETGLRLKVRFDYLRIRHLADLKSYAWREGKTAVDSFVDAIDTFGYDFSYAAYMGARVSIFPRLVASGDVYDVTGIEDADVGMPIAEALEIDVSAFLASEADQEFARKVAAFKDPEWAWIACMTQGFPEVDVVRLPEDLLAYQAAEVQVENAKEVYRHFRATFGDGPDAAWVSLRKTVTLTEMNMGNGRARDRGAVKHEEG